MFALTVPGLAGLAVRSMGGLDGVTPTDQGFDGRSDVVLLDVGRGARSEVVDASLVEDVFVEVGRASRADGDSARRIAGRLWPEDLVARALSIWAEERGPLRAGMSFRVIVRVLQENSFLRTDLRREMTTVISQDRPKWKFADPSDLEVWVIEFAPGRFVAGLRLSDERMRQHGGRSSQRQGALRPTVAAALVELAGRPDGLLLDPCCGSGTILVEAARAGWHPVGIDIDPSAVEIARENAPSAEVSVGDVRHLRLDTATVGASVSNLPFGKQFELEGDPQTWLRQALTELVRVTRPGGHVVVLVPHLSRPAIPRDLTMTDHVTIRLLGTPTTIWAFTRA
jgi:SAM-dependent methyltransferase